jgi:hypothetical protein
VGEIGVRDELYRLISKIENPEIANVITRPRLRV